MAVQDAYECDVLVIGSGASGMSAAVSAAAHGLKVLIIEKEPKFGGTTARSGGWLWLPGTSLAKAWGFLEYPMPWPARSPGSTANRLIARSCHRTSAPFR